MTILNKCRTYFLYFLYIHRGENSFLFNHFKPPPWKKWLEFEKWILHLVTCCSSVFLPPSCTWPPPWAPAWRWTWRSSSLCLVRREACSGAVQRSPACHGLGWRGRRPRYGDQGPAAHTRVTEHFSITEKAPTRVFSWLKAPTSAVTFKKLLRH